MRLDDATRERQRGFISSQQVLGDARRAGSNPPAGVFAGQHEAAGYFRIQSQGFQSIWRTVPPSHLWPPSRCSGAPWWLPFGSWLNSVGTLQHAPFGPQGGRLACGRDDASPDEGGPHTDWAGRAGRAPRHLMMRRVMFLPAVSSLAVAQWGIAGAFGQPGMAVQPTVGRWLSEVGWLLLRTSDGTASSCNTLPLWYLDRPIRLRSEWAHEGICLLAVDSGKPKGS